MSIHLGPGGETEPLLRSLTNEGHQYTFPTGSAAIDNVVKNETVIVEFDPTGDAENPLDWPTPFKWSVVGFLVMTAFTVYVFFFPWTT